MTLIEHANLAILGPRQSRTNIHRGTSQCTLLSGSSVILYFYLCRLTSKFSSQVSSIHRSFVQFLTPVVILLCLDSMSARRSLRTYRVGSLVHDNKSLPKPSKLCSLNRDLILSHSGNTVLTYDGAYHGVRCDSKSKWLKNSDRCHVKRVKIFLVICFIAD